MTKTKDVAVVETATDGQTETVELLQEILATRKRKKTFKNVGIEKTGNRIIIPDGMEYKEARTWLKRQEDSEEQVVAFQTGLRAYPFDGAYAMYRAIKDIFGFADLTSVKGPSKDDPPEMIGIRLPDGSTVKVPWGRIQFPGFDGDSYVETSYNTEKMQFEIRGKIKRKFEDMMDKITNRTQEILDTDSIYKGHAIKVDLGFIGEGSFPTDPTFINVSGIKDSDVLLNKVAERDYSAVLMRIEQTDKCKENNIPLKHGCLLAGPYGTGKTLMAKWTARKAIENGWTFIYLEDCTQMKDALRLAEMYQPAIVFAEDIDKAMEGERSREINEILNTLDGIDTKSKPIITILTTNHLENINKAFLRAGRIDSLIHLGPLDKDTALQFITNFSTNGKGKSILDPKKDYKKAASAMDGIVPAFAAEVINKAKMYAMYRTGSKNSILVPEDIETAAHSLKQHIKLTEETVQYTANEKLGNIVKEVFLNSIDGTKLNDVVDALHSEYI